MAWPNTSMVTFIANGPPAVDDVTMNSLQNAINAMLSNQVTPNNGTAGQMYSFYALNVDGVGGQPATPPAAGTVSVSASASATSAPTPTIAKGVLYKDLVPFAWAHVYNNGTTATLVRGANVTSVSRQTTGRVRVTFTVAASDSNYVAIANTYDGIGLSGGLSGFCCINNLTTTYIDVDTINATGNTSADARFFVFVMAA